ncbi:chloride channel protein [Vagococcus fluvialis]|uniref:chloride channel protein n=1 Tax=Vagococcus fluvialis TaxID=2738 RepID=UPI001D0B3BAE|nr:chloride channel protein [Vagococcus fluvialis]UDM80578.1 chloride channel protein [Vagococcus fluvialis]
MIVRKEASMLFFSLIIGCVVGALEVGFGKILLLVTSIRINNFGYWILLLPIIGLLIEWLYKTFSQKSQEGMGLIFKVGQGEELDIPLMLIPLVTVTTWLTHLFGGSAGREGVAVQIGAALSSWVSKLKIFSNLDKEEFSKTAIVIGMAAGFSGLFQTPLAATFFALEVLIVGKLEMKSIFYTGIAAYTSYFVSRGLDLEKSSFIINHHVEMTSMLVVKLLILGFLFSLVGLFFSVSLKQAKAYFTRWMPNNYQKILVGGSIVAILALVLHTGRYSGLGTNLIEASFQGEIIYSYDFLLKIMLTVLTLAVGFQGGEVTPLFAIGSSFGVVMASFMGLPIEFVAALGYVAVFGSATNTFLAPILIGAEVFGYEWLPYFFITMLTAYHCNFNVSIYGKQKNLNEYL